MNNAATLDAHHAFPEETVAVSPPKDKAVDAQQIIFTLPMVVGLVCSMAVGGFAVGAMRYVSDSASSQTREAERTALAQMQSDIRSIKESQLAQAEIDKANKRADDAERDSQKQSFESTKQSVDTLRGAVQLMQLQVAELLKQKR